MKQPLHNAYSLAEATVTVNSLPTDRFGPWWRHAFDVDNDTSAAYTQAVITAVQSNLYFSVTGHVFVAETPESFTYDDDGNLTQDGRFTYAWDAENRLISIETATNLPASVPRVRVTHRYDHRSRRIATERETWSGSAWQPAGTNRYLYDGWNVVAETRSASPANTNLYVWGLDLSGSLQGAGGIGGLLTVRKRLEDGTGIVRNYDYLFDANGNVVQEILRTDGAINAHYEYDPFGTAVVALRVDATDNPFRFSTKWFDNDTGLGYWGYRWYSPGLGRWMSRDPIEERGGIALYEFVHNVPLQAIDSLGKNTFLLTCNATVDPPGNCGAFKVDRPFAVSSGAVDGHVIQLMSMRFSVYSCKTGRLITGLSTQGPIKFYEAFKFDGTTVSDTWSSSEYSEGTYGEGVYAGVAFYTTENDLPMPPWQPAGKGDYPEGWTGLPPWMGATHIYPVTKTGEHGVDMESNIVSAVARFSWNCCCGKKETILAYSQL